MFGSQNIGYQRRELAISYRVPDYTLAMPKKSLSKAGGPKPQAIARHGGKNSPFPNKMPFSVTYGDVWLLNGGSGVKVQSFRMNSLFDPDLSGAGGTPTYANQLAEIYQSYLVDKIDVEAEFFSFNSELQMVGLIWHPSGEAPVSSITQIQQIALEGSNSLFATMPGKGSNSNTPKITLRKQLVLQDVEGCPLDDNFRADFGANPVNMMGLDLFSIDPSGIDDQATQVIVRITYHGYAYGRSALTYTD